MNLYRIKTYFQDNGLDDKVAILGYVVAEDDSHVYDHINKKHREEQWADTADMPREAIIAAKGDWKSDLPDRYELYTQKYGWEFLGPVSPDDTSRLRRLRLLDE